MGAAKKAKALGFKNLNQVAEYSGWSRASLDKMSVKHPDRFEAVLFGAKVKMRNKAEKLRCWEGGNEETCDCPDCGSCLVGIDD